MGRRKLNFTSLFSKTNGDPTTTTTTSPKYNTSSSSPSSPFPYWPSCNHPKTNSFRRDENNFIYKTINSVYFDSKEYSAFTHSSDEFFLDSDDDSEALIHGLRSSDRLFFDPGAITRAILNEEVTRRDNIINPFTESVVMAMESKDPYSDFKKSMEEMMVVNGMKDWESLEKLLVWYLKVNGKKNHGFIVGAFVDLLVGIGFYSSGEINEKDVTSCSSNSMSSMTFEIEELEEGSGSC